MTTVALTGHTRGLGKQIKLILDDKKYDVAGFSLSTGCDLRDYTQVGHMIDQIQHRDWFINCAHPDYCQTQILYRLISSGFGGKILNIGSPVVHQDPGWTDLGLMEYVSQKTALWHAYTTLNAQYPGQVFMWEPQHTTDRDYVAQCLAEFGL